MNITCPNCGTHHLYNPFIREGHKLAYCDCGWKAIKIGDQERWEPGLQIPQSQIEARSAERMIGKVRDNRLEKLRRDR